MDFMKEAEGALSNKWVWLGLGGVALVGAFLFVNSQIAAANAASAPDSSGSSLMYPSTIGSDPLTSVGTSTGDASSSDGSSSDTSALMDLETTMSNNNLTLGLAQLQSQTSAAQAQAQAEMYGLQTQQNTDFVSSITSALTSIFGKNGNGTTANQNLNGVFNIGGTPFSFSINDSNYKGGDSGGFFTAVGTELGQNAQIAGTGATSSAPAGTTAGSGGGSTVASGQSSATGVSSVVSGARASLA